MPDTLTRFRRDVDSPSSHAVAFLPSGRDDYVASHPMTFDAWLRMDYEGGLSEWVDGEARLYMSATNSHQRIVDFLNQLLGVFVRLRGLGIVRSAPYAMESGAGGRRGREPDLMFVAAANVGRMGESHFEGAPDLVIEVVSADSAARDYQEKLTEYALAGVREYWIIDSRSGHERASFYRLADGEFEPADATDGLYRTDLLPGFRLDVASLWANDAVQAKALAGVLTGADDALNSQ